MTEGQESVEVRDGQLSDLPRILALLKQAKATVGFLPNEAVEERIRKGTLLVASAGHEIAGYLLYDLVDECVAIRQLAVDRQARNLGASRALVSELVARYESSRRGIRLWCRRDYEANDVWHRLGFSPRNERSGRGKSTTVLTLWWRTFGQSDLFSIARDQDDRPLAALDTNLLIKGSDGDPEVVEHLLADWVRAEVAFEVVDHSLVELNRQVNDEVRQRHVRYASCFDDVRYSADVAEVLLAAAARALGDAARPHRGDILLATRAAAGGARWFVTEDASFRRACRQILHEVAEIDVVSVSEMLLAVDQMARNETYEGRYLQGTEIEVREVESGDLDTCAEIFLNQRAGEAFKSWRRHLSAIAADVVSTRIHVFSDANGPIALAAVATGDVLTVPVCRVRRGPAEPTIARQLLGWLRDRCSQTGSTAVVVTDPNPGQWIESRYASEGFFLNPEPTAVPVSGVVSFDQIADTISSPPLGSSAFREQADEIRTLARTPTAAHSLESTFHPAIVVGAELRTVRVPINPQFAAELFDHVLSDERLWRRDRAVALRREHVYFRSPTASLLLEAPARLLWQVTGSKRHGGGALRARSLLDETAVGAVDQLISRFSHLGVLNRDEISAMAKGGKVMALRFSHTTVFSQPVSLAEYRRIMERVEPGKGLTHAGPQPVSEQVFVEVAMVSS